MENQWPPTLFMSRNGENLVGYILPRTKILRNVKKSKFSIYSVATFLFDLFSIDNCYVLD